MTGSIIDFWATAMSAFTSLHDRLGDLYINLDGLKAYGVNACSVQDLLAAEGILATDLDILPEMPMLEVQIAGVEDSKARFKQIRINHIRTGRIYDLPLTGGNERITLLLE